MVALDLFFPAAYSGSRGMGTASGGRHGRRDRIGGCCVDLVADRASRRAWRGYCIDGELRHGRVQGCAARPPDSGEARDRPITVSENRS